MVRGIDRPTDRPTFFKQQISDTAQPSKCRNCGSRVWRLLVNGVETILDPELLSVAAELIYRISYPKRATYAIVRDGSTWYARYRSQQAIITKPDGQLILADHQHKTLATSELPEYFPPRYTYEIPERPAF
jgi:hypothetical protein